MSKEITETLDTDESDRIDESTTRYLNQHNPVEELSGLDGKKVQTSATVSDIEVPHINKIIFGDSPNIQMKLTHKDINEEIIMSIQLDRFSSENGLTSMSDFTNAYRIKRDQIDEIVGEEIEIMVEKNSSSYRATPAFQNLDRLESENSCSSTRVENLKSLWRAEDYGKAKIVSVNSPRSKSSNRLVVSVEIPWLNKEQKILFGVGPNDPYHSVESLFESITGHFPINEEQVSGIIGEEINVSYKGSFGLSDRLENQIKQNEYSFKMFLNDNKDALKGMSVKNLVFVSLIYIFPPITLIPIVLLMPLFKISVFAGAVGAIGLAVISALLITLIKAREKYGNGNHISN